MLRSCVCFGRGSGSKRRTSSLEDSSSCRSSEIERGVERSIEVATTTKSSTTGSAPSSLLQLFHSKGWYRHWRKPTRGMSMTKVERTMKAALLIQRWHRRNLARMEVRRRYTWTIFQNLEYAGEQDQVELYNFFNALLTHIPDAATLKGTGSTHSSRTTSSENLDSKFSDESDCNEDEEPAPEKTYRGPHLQFPLVKKDIDTLIDLFRKKKSNSLHAKYVGAILREAASKLKRLPNLNQASTAISKQVTIIGDLHGKLDDLLVVFHKNGLPSTENPYVFNGDFVDRGKKGLEVFLLLLSCFLAFPGTVFLNRGNHEDTVMNARYGFIREVQQKYRRNSEKLLKMIDEVYRWLPLGTIINNRVLVVHGGLSDTTNLDLLKSLNRGKYISILRPPIETTSEVIDKVEWKQVFDIMWSDPQHIEGCVPNSLRGAGTYFGPDVTDRFLIKYKLKYLVRSHECKPEGYEFTHDERVITIFSASNYYAIGSNKGAYLKFNPQLEPHFVQYISAASRTRQWTFNQKIGLIESSALRELGARLRDHRKDLEREFRKHDPDGNGLIPIAKWCDSMEHVTNLGLPWRLLRDKLAPMTDDAPLNKINYFATLDLLDTDIIIQAQEAETSVADSLYKNKSSLEAIFHILDKDNSGHISLDEFGEACDLLAKHLHGASTRDELLEMCKLMDINRDGFVDLNEFLEAFRLCDQTHQSQRARQSGGGDGGTASSMVKSSNGAVTPMQNESAKFGSVNLNPTPTKSNRRNTLNVTAAASKFATSSREEDVEADIDPTDHVSTTSKH